MKNQQTGILEDQDFIVFGEDFGRHPHSLEHLLRPLFARNRFIWVETIGIRSPKLSVYDFKRVVEKLKSWFGPSRSPVVRVVPETITIVSPFMIPFNQYGLVRVFNRWSVARTVRKALRAQKISQPITVSSVPNAADYVGDFDEAMKVFVCVDDFSLWPGLDYDLVRGMEKKILAKSDLVFATSQALADTKENGLRKTILLTHGVDFQHFNIGSKESFSKPLKICYFGLFDERSDQRILSTLATGVPDCEIHILGNVVCDTQELEKHQNILFRGPVAYSRLPEVIREMDIFVLPYVRSELTDNINPLKLKEYLSTGRPVIATPLPEVVKLKQHLLLGSTGDEFVALIEEVRSGARVLNTEATLEYLQQKETWTSKASFFSSEVIQLLNRQG